MDGGQLHPQLPTAVTAKFVWDGTSAAVELNLNEFDSVAQLVGKLAELGGGALGLSAP